MVSQTSTSAFFFLSFLLLFDSWVLLGVVPYVCLVRPLDRYHLCVCMCNPVTRSNPCVGSKYVYDPRKEGQKKIEGGGM